MERLFIYGTLAPGRPNEHKLSHLNGQWEEAYVKGTLYEEGWGAQMGYPGIILNDEASEVQGFVLNSDKLHTMWDELDAFEGAEYQRVLTKAYLNDGSEVDAYIYALNK